MQNLIRRYGTDLEKRAKRPPTPRRIPSDTPKIPGEGSPRIFRHSEGLRRGVAAHFPTLRKSPARGRRAFSDTPKASGEGSPHIFYLPEGGFSENKTIFGGDSINPNVKFNLFPTMKTIVKIKDFGITKLNNAEYQLLDPRALW